MSSRCLIDEAPVQPVPPTLEHLDTLRHHIRRASDLVAPDAVQDLTRAMTVKIDINGRAHITPTFRIPIQPEPRHPPMLGTVPPVRLELTLCGI